ncbi:hypothetical protein P2G88_03825 [Aliiglaciecola sp. CAU 1673]|uniref:hypothetical protein n=1 Tax=Aliiglaciecola sp. CAU 1673 TaxID=3032595 RepID=UPI0023DC532D|nr:hypothetical protein [Aliiglaciecola sp. CAU 1673]MDF2177372.1 hypothetical protein [Aliiglaciecola sp. CAU 1673]
MLPIRALYQYAVSRGLIIMLMAGLLYPAVSHADNLRLHSYSLRAHLTEKTVLGQSAT